MDVRFVAPACDLCTGVTLKYCIIVLELLSCQTSTIIYPYFGA